MKICVTIKYLHMNEKISEIQSVFDIYIEQIKTFECNILTFKLFCRIQVTFG
jgi:hypothetical protein